LAVLDAGVLTTVFELVTTVFATAELFATVLAIAELFTTALDTAELLLTFFSAAGPGFKTVFEFVAC
jgi:hypothetical protein